LSFLLSLTTFTDYYFYGLHEFSWGYIAKGGPAFQLYGVYSLATMMYVIMLSVRKLKSTTDPTYRLKLKYLMLSMCTLGVMSLGNIPAINGINIYPVGNFGFIPILVMAWGIYRHDIIRINQYTKRRIFGSMTRAAIIMVLATAVGFGIWIFWDYSLDHIIEKTIPYGLPPLLSFLVCVFLSLIGPQLGENRRESVVFSLAILVYALLSFDIYCNCILTDQELGLLISRVNHAFLVFLPSLILHLVLLVTKTPGTRWMIVPAYSLSALFALSTHSDLYLSGSFRYFWGFHARVGILFNVMSFLSTIYLTYCLLLMWRSYRETTDKNIKRRYIFLLIGTSATALLTFGNIPAMLGHEIYPSGNFIFIPVILLTMGIFKYNLEELKRLGGKILYYGVLFSGIAVAAMHLPGLMNQIPQPLNYTLAFSFILVFGYTWRIIHQRIFASRKRELAKTYEDLIYRLSKCHTTEEITGTLCDSLFRTVLSETCTILHLDTTNESYRAQRTTSAPHLSSAYHDDGKLLPPIPGKHPLSALFFLTRRPLRQEEIEEWLLREDSILEPGDMIRNAAFSIPFFFEDRLPALALLGPKRDASLYSKDETDFFNRLSLGVGPYLENANILHNLENLVSERTGALRDSELKYRHIIENARDLIYKADWKGNFTFVNEAFVRMLGYPREEILRMNYIDVIWPDHGEEQFAFYRKQLKNRVPESFQQLPCIMKSGDRIWIEQSVRSIFGKDGRIIEFDCIARDITELKEAEEARLALEEALRASEEKYRNLLDSQLIGYYEVDLKGAFTLCNKSMATFLGYTPEELNGKSYREVMKPDSAERALSDFGKFFTDDLTVAVVELDMLHRDGHSIYSESYVSLMRDEKGRPKGFSGVGIDISARKKAEEALRLSEELHRLVLDNVEDLVFTCGMDGKFIYGNMAAKRITGYPLKEALGKSFLHFIHPEDRERELNSYLKQLKDHIDTTHHEFRILKKDGSVAWLSQTTRMVKHEDGRIEFYCTARDMTEKKKAEDARRELGEQKSRFFANVSHEIRTPLTLVLSPVESYLQGDFGEAGREFFENIYRNGLRLLKLINNLLDFAKIESGRMSLRIQVIDPVPFMRDYLKTVSDTARSRDISLRFESSADSIGGLYADREKLDKLVMNLLSNAIKFTDAGGVITVRVHSDGVFCHIEIEDTGCGIPSDMIGRIFERFSQAEAGADYGSGTGIGLALAKEFAGLHGGNITVKSRYKAEYPADHGTVSL